MKFKLEMKCDNVAFEGDDLREEIARILRKVAAAVETYGVGMDEKAPLIDRFGNKVGFAELVEED